MHKIEPLIVENYIVRIYRRDEENLRGITGIVENVGTEDKKVFHNLDELCTILTISKSYPVRKERSSKTKR